MTEILMAAIVFLVLNIVAGLIVILRGPSATDRLLAVQLAGSLGVAALLMISEVTDVSAGRDMALVIVTLTALTAIVFVRRYWPQRLGKGKQP